MRLLFLFLTFCVTSTQLSLDHVRLAYKEAAQDKTKVDSFYDMLSNITKSDDVALVAYKGAAIALKGKYAKSLKEKKDDFIEGVTLIEYAIEKEPNAIEPHFVRLGIQENTPKFLGYKKNIEADKLFILKQYKHITSPNLKAHIKDYILQSKVFTDEEKATIN